MSATVLITGAAGLIGSAVVRLLLERGCAVVACDDFSIGEARLEHPRLVWERVDVADSGLGDRLDRHKPDVVVHAAAHPGGQSLTEPADNVRVNALGGIRVFEWCARAKVPVVFLSSSAVYGEQPPIPTPEDAPLRPGTVYAVCKVACEEYLRVLEAGYGLQWTVLRLFSTYGAGHRPSLHQGLVNVLLTQLMVGDSVTVRGSLDRIRDLLYVEDAARAIVTCAFNADLRGRTLNVGIGSGVSVRELIGLLCESLDRDVDDVRIEEASPIVGDPRYSVADTTALSACTEFQPQYSIQAGLANLVRARLAGTQR